MMKRAKVIGLNVVYYVCFVPALIFSMLGSIMDEWMDFLWDLIDEIEGTENGFSDHHRRPPT